MVTLWWGVLVDRDQEPIEMEETEAASINGIIDKGWFHSVKSKIQGGTSLYIHYDVHACSSLG